MNIKIDNLFYIFVEGERKREVGWVFFFSDNRAGRGSWRGCKSYREEITEEGEEEREREGNGKCAVRGGTRFEKKAL